MSATLEVAGQPAMSQQEAVNALFEFGAQRLMIGDRPKAVVEKMVEMGIDRDLAVEAVDHLVVARRKAKRDFGRKHMVYGLLWVAGGAAVTWLTYGAASGSGGGRYVVAWGAMLFGAIDFVRGGFMALTGR